MCSPAKAKSSGASGQAGSIAAGGRYDSLVGMVGKPPMPCVGLSFGVDRIFTILPGRRLRPASVVPREVDVYVMAFGGKDGLPVERMAVARQLWDADIRAELAARVKPKLPQQFKAAKDVPLAVILSQDELDEGLVRLKVLGKGGGETGEKDRGLLVSRALMVVQVRKALEIVSQSKAIRYFPFSLNFKAVECLGPKSKEWEKSKQWRI